MEYLFSRENFIALSKEVRALVQTNSWWQRHGFEFFILFARLVLTAGGFFIFSYQGWWFKLVGLAVISYGYYGITITGTHESRHNAWVESAKANKLWGYVFGDFMGGESSVWWHAHHVLEHHVFTNIPGQEDEYFMFPWINKYVYFFVAPFLVFFALFIGSCKFLWRKWGQLLVYLTLFVAGYIFHSWLFSFFVSWPAAFLYAFIMRSFYAPTFMHLALFNHIGLERPDKKLPWLPHQTKTTRNIEPHWFLIGMGGNAFVHRHIEHHLFPSLSNRMIAKINPIVTDYLKKEGYLYLEQSYTSCLKNCLKYYRELFTKGPPPIMIK